ncbi:MAG: sulfotransferase [Candidatus Latescibacterota bacterium]|nr:MAG: sulfotransferase [Candidatus Latescibacterota bacterium]
MKNIPVAYITSSSYSGSTLLALILNAHPAIGTISEVDAMGDIAKDPDYRCSCGEKIRECRFFIELRDAIRAKGLPFEVHDMDMLLRLSGNPRINAALTEKIPRVNSSIAERVRDSIVDLIPWYRREKARMYSRNQAMFQAVLDLQKASVFLDNNKNPYRMLFLSKRFDVKVIYLFKNGIAGAYSYLKSAKYFGKSRTVEAATHKWFREQITICRCLARLDQAKYTQISYSELCGNPEGTMKKICGYLGIESLSLRDFANAPHHVVGNLMRLGNFSEIRETTDWRDNMSEVDIDRYRKTASKYLPRLRALNPTIAEHVWL